MKTFALKPLLRLIATAGYDTILVLEHEISGREPDKEDQSLQALSQELQGIDVEDLDTDLTYTLPNTNNPSNRNNKSNINTAPTEFNNVQDFPSSAPYFAKSTIDDKLRRLHLRRTGKG